MLINALTFDIHDFKNHTDESFMVCDTVANFELITQSRVTRALKFVKVFDFQFARERKAPLFMKKACLAEYLEEREREFEIDNVDEMFGAF